MQLRVQMLKATPESGLTADPGNYEFSNVTWPIFRDLHIGQDSLSRSRNLQVARGTTQTNMFRLNGWIVRSKDGRTLHHMTKLAHISPPVVFHQ